MQSFSELSISPRLKERLTAAKFSMLTPVQVAAIPLALEQRTELFQLERALGFRMERVSTNGGEFEKIARTSPTGRERTRARGISAGADGLLASAGKTLRDDRMPMRINVRLSRCAFVFFEPFASSSRVLSSILR